MTDIKTYKLAGYTVKIEPDEDLPGCMCRGCVFHGKNQCPSAHDEHEAGIEQTCIEGDHKYVEVQAGVQECGK